MFTGKKQAWQACDFTFVNKMKLFLSCYNPLLLIVSSAVLDTAGQEVRID